MSILRKIDAVIARVFICASAQLMPDRCRRMKMAVLTLALIGFVETQVHSRWHSPLAMASPIAAFAVLGLGRWLSRQIDVALDRLRDE